MSYQITNLISLSKMNHRVIDFALEVIEGLSKKQKKLPSWLIFDNQGSEKFQEITKLADYHPSVCELEIFQTYTKQISDLIPKEPINLIELGSGDGKKTMILLEYILNHKKLEYYPIDISEGAIKNLLDSIKSRLKNQEIQVNGIVAEYFQGLEWLIKNRSKMNFVLFLGSSIGNFNPPAAQSFMKQLWYFLNHGDQVLIGFDLMKDPKLLYKAYNDPGGVFENFNLHLLHRINQELEANFNVKAFIQQGQYNLHSKAVESYIYSTREQKVAINLLKRQFHFKLWEGLQTEHSYKFTLPEIEFLGRDAGFETVTHFFDAKNHFVDSVFKVKKQS